MESDMEWKTQAKKAFSKTRMFFTDKENPYLRIAKDQVVEAVRPLIYDCRRTDEESKQLDRDINLSLIYLHYVESELAKKEKPKNYFEWARDRRVWLET
jgi:hypothetical protein